MKQNTAILGVFPTHCLYVKLASHQVSTAWLYVWTQFSSFSTIHSSHFNYWHPNLHSRPLFWGTPKDFSNVCTKLYIMIYFLSNLTESSSHLAFSLRQMYTYMALCLFSVLHWLYYYLTKLRVPVSFLRVQSIFPTQVSFNRHSQDSEAEFFYGMKLK